MNRAATIAPIIEDDADLCASAPDCPSPSEHAAVEIEWGHADEGCDLRVRQGAEFQETRQEGRGHDEPHPGTLCNSSSFSCHTGLWRMASAKLVLVCCSSHSSHVICVRRRVRIGDGALRRRFFSAVSISSSCRRQVNSTAKVRVSAFGSGRGWRRMTSANCANTWALSASILAKCPLALAKSRT